jgi:SpoVK/Ycf46/Vps4 family AAA+-type ATPase
LDPSLGAQALENLTIIVGSLPQSVQIVSLVASVFDLCLSADKIPSETEAWAAARVMAKVRGTPFAAAVAQKLRREQHVQRPSEARSLPAASKPAAVPPEESPASQPAAVPSEESPVKRIVPVVATHSHATDSVNGLLLELNRLVGLESVKFEVETLMNLAKVRAIRTQRGLPSPAMSFHLVFSGNPGTGKTTVARLIGKMYGALGLLSHGECIEVDRTSLIGQYLGQTTTKTAVVLRDALGSVVFLDEAYSLADDDDGNADAYGREALAVILKFMEDHREDFVLIAAGYTGLMEQFLQSNPGLRSRFSRTIQFPDYSAAELTEIFHRMCQASGYVLARDARTALERRIAQIVSAKSEDFANAREARKLFEKAVERQANRIADQFCSDAELCTLEAEDFETAFDDPSERRYQAG